MDDRENDAPLVDFLIVGTMKSGTSSLGFHLGNHRDICIPAHEVHFFDRRKNLAKGVEWYRRELRRGCTSPVHVVGEKTPTYSYREDVAERIYRLVPEVKLIWIFRNPVDRAYSNYLHMVRAGSESLSFERAVRDEPRRIRRNIFLGYVERSRYHLQVDRFLRWFPREQMHFMLFEALTRDPIVELSRLFDFLGVSPERFGYEDEQRHPTVLPRWPVMTRLARRFLGRSPAFWAVRRLNTVGQEPGYPRLDPELRSTLVARFRQDNAELARLTGLDVSGWDR